MATVSLVDGALIYAAAFGEENDVTLDDVAGTLVIRDAGAAISASPEFAVVSLNEVTIPTASVTRISISVGDMDDRAEILPSVFIDAEIFGGVGSNASDVLIGGSGDDFIYTFAGNNTMNGGGGNDHLTLNLFGSSINQNAESIVVNDSTATRDGVDVDTFSNFESVGVQSVNFGVHRTIDGSATTGVFRFGVLLLGGDATIFGGAGDGNVDIHHTISEWGPGTANVDLGAGFDTLQYFYDNDITLTDATITTAGFTSTLTGIDELFANSRGAIGGLVIDASAITAGAFANVGLGGGPGNDAFFAGNFNGTLGGGGGDDTFVFGDDWGNVFVDGGSGRNVADFSAVSSSLLINTYTSITGGFVQSGSNVADVFVNEIVSGSGSDVLEGQFENLTWNILAPNTVQASNPDNVGIETAIVFGVENVRGQFGDDAFVFADGASLSGSIDGGQGFDTLDYTAYTSDPNVVVAGAGTIDGQAGAADNLGVGFDNIDDILLPVLNEAPTADDKSATVTEDGKVAIALSGSDAETPAASLVFTVVSLPTEGRLTTAGGVLVEAGQQFAGAPTLHYEPGAAREGAGVDGFEYIVTDGGAPALSSDVAAVGINIVKAVADGKVVIGPDKVARIGGTAGNDDILVTRTLLGNKLRVRINGKWTETSVAIATLNDIRIWGRDGNDQIVVLLTSGSAMIHGGAGNDEIIGESQSAVIFGGTGNDKLWGSLRDGLVIGGAGADITYGSLGDDVLVGGDVSSQLTLAMLRQVVDDWSGGVQDSEFVDSLVDDAAVDTLFDALGDDWLAVGSGDVAVDLNPWDDDALTTV